MNWYFHKLWLLEPALTDMSKVGDFCSSLEVLMLNANSHFGTLRYALIMYTVLFTYVAHYWNNKKKLVLITSSCIKYLS